MVMSHLQFDYSCNQPERRTRRFAAIIISSVCDKSSFLCLSEVRVLSNEGHGRGRGSWDESSACELCTMQ